MRIFHSFKKQGGFSLTELLIYIGILAVSAGVLTGILQTTTTTQVQESAQNEVAGQLNFAMKTMQRLVQDSSYIDMTPGTSSSTLRLKMHDSDSSTTPSTDYYTLIYPQNGVIYVQEQSNDPHPITSDKVTVDSLSFTKFTRYPAHDSVQIDLAMTGAQQTSASSVTRALRSVVSRASAVTFDSDLLPGSDNAYTVGNTSNKWLNAEFSGDVTVGGSVDAGQLCISGVCQSSWGAGGGVSGSGTTGYVSKWTSSSALGNSVIYDDGTKIGIGTATPQGKLEIVTTDLAGGSPSPGSGVVRISNGGNPDLRFAVDSINKFALIEATEMGVTWDMPLVLQKEDGNVGIGTTAPKVKLQSTGSAGTSIPSKGSAGGGFYITNTDDKYGILMGVLGSGKGWIQNQRTDGTATAYDLLLQPNDGNVGIGTTSPGSKLDVYNTADEIMRLSRSSATSTIFRLGTDSALVINNNGTDTLTLDNGKVGIGTTAPEAALHIKRDAFPVRVSERTTTLTGNTLATDLLKLTTSSNMTDGFGPAFVFAIEDSAAVENYIASISAVRDTADNSGALLFKTYNGGSSSEKMRITTSGSVGIGTTLPGTNKLYVNGTAHFASDITLGASATVDGYNISNYGPYWVNSAGELGQVWTSLGSGRGHWSASEITGSGTTNRLPKWTSGSALGNSVITDSGNGGNGVIYINHNVFSDNYGLWVQSSSNYTHGVIGEGSARGVVGDGAYGVEGDGTTYDFYASGTGTNYGPFTGAHDVIFTKDTASSLTPGLIVSVTGQTEKRLREDGSVSLSSTMPHIKLSDTEKDSAILGVFVSTNNDPEPNFWYTLKDNEKRGIVNALGEGRVWVTDINGNIKAGDYITTSSVPGYGQKQNDDVVHSYTLGKATESPNWSSAQTITQNGKTYHKYLIGVVYTSG